MYGTAGKIHAYTVKVGYLDNPLGDRRVIDSTDEWEDYARLMSKPVYDGQGNVTLVRPKGLKGYDQEFFATGNRLVATYQILSSGSYSPSVISCDVDERTGILVIEYKRDGRPGMALTMDMSGFIIVAEIPAGVSFDDIEVSLVP